MSQTSVSVELADGYRSPTHNSRCAKDTQSLRECSHAEEGQRPPTRAEEMPLPSILQTSIIIAAVAGVTTTNSMTTGLLTIALPKMAEELDIPNHLLLWPVSIFGLTSGCFLLLAGAFADAIGSRIVYLAGCLLTAVCILAIALARTSLQIIVFRGFQGVAASCTLPTAISILSDNFPDGRRRHIGFALLGAGQAIGYSLGLFLGGFFIDSIGWRAGWYLCTGVASVVLITGTLSLPSNRTARLASWKELIRSVDWVGALLAALCLGIMSYVLAVVSGRSSSVQKPRNLVLLSISVALVPVFAFWMHIRVKAQKPALIPNYLWRNVSFSAICIMVSLTWATLFTIEYYFSLILQKVQYQSAISTSVRFLPNIVIGVILSICTGTLIHKLSSYYFLLLTSLLSIVSPLLLAIADPEWPYWYGEFWAILLSPLAADSLFVISNVIITASFPARTHALAGAVFNTIAQFGTAVGLAVMAAISSSVTDASSIEDKNSPGALLEGYRASFWACFGATVVTCGVGAVGLRQVGRLGVKVE